ncbi:hypothetical protein AB9F29_12355 [Falsihalocynthiibacter sp. S25ZX9]|uniref:hypothetical protein n=1 Tax=Falsihalocynthiibacter sp. S25ZX9 TaxID=3240870 RepID=UPI00350ED031
MKPSFALNLSHEGIRLFSRATGGWRLVGETDLDTPDLAETLAYLRNKATKLSGSGLSSKLILPNSQILFTSLTAQGPDDASREAQIREALRDLTPYDPSELVFDWRVAGDMVNVAAVAKETLQEAEAFAVEHRFNPVSFVGDTTDANFEGEPFFGATAFSSAFLDQEDAVEKDFEAFVILDKMPNGKNKIFSGKLQKSVLLTPAAEDKVKPTEELMSEIPTEISAPEVTQQTVAEDTVPSDDIPVVEPEISDPEASKEDKISSSKRRLSIALGTQPESEEEASIITQVDPQLDTSEATESDEGPSDDLEFQNEEAPDTTSVPDLEAFFSSIDAKKPVLNQQTPPIPAHLSKVKGTSSVPPSIAVSRKALTAERSDTGGAGEFVHRPVAAPKIPDGIAARLKNNGAKQSEKPASKSLTQTARGLTSWRRKSQSEDTQTPPFASTREPTDIEASETRQKPSDAVLSPDLVVVTKSEPLPLLAPIIPTPVVSESASSDPIPSFEERLAHAHVTSADMELPDSEHLSASLGHEAQLARDNDFKPAAVQPPLDVTVFGARKNKASSSKTPRFLGLFLLLTLLLVMGIAVLWSVMGPIKDARINIDSDVGTFTEFNAQAQTSAQEAALPEDSVFAAFNAEAEIEAEADNFDLELEIPSDQTLSIVEPTRPALLTVAEAEKTYNDSGIWQRSPDLKPAPEIEDTDHLYVPSLDPEVDLSDPVALPTADALPDDSPIPQQPSPAPAGSTFALGDNGLVVPSADGTINPDGILVFSGPPPKRAAPRPDTGDVPQTTDLAQTEIGNKRPLARPENLADLREIALLGGRTREQLARLRPAPRPVSEQIAAQTSPEGVALSTTATEFAVSTSRIPKTRPNNFAALVEKARANPKNVAEKETVVAAVAAKPSAAATGPKIPTRASVAKEATQKNMISLRKIALIGVYGTPSKRSALVRMGNGKIIEVSVGDRVDGGKVAAIGADEIRYVKGGRNISLKMPPRG